MNNQSVFMCPVCGKYDFKTIGTFEICPICNWENDYVQSSDHNYSGGANHLSVNESRIEFYLLHHAGAKEKMSIARDIYHNKVREIYSKYYPRGAATRLNEPDKEREEFKSARQKYLDSLSDILQNLTLDD